MTDTPRGSAAPTPITLANACDRVEWQLDADTLKLRDALFVVLRDHQERVEGGFDGTPENHTGKCGECFQPWPCGTFLAIWKAVL